MSQSNGANLWTRSFLLLQLSLVSGALVFGLSVCLILLCWGSTGSPSHGYIVSFYVESCSQVWLQVCGLMQYEFVLDAAEFLI